MTKLLKPLAWLALLGFPIALVLYRFGLINFAQSFKLLIASGLTAAVVFILSVLFSVLKRQDRVASKAASTAMIIALVPLLGLGSQAFKGRSLPVIHNISTDPIDPPMFNKVVALRGEGTNPLEYDAQKLATLQQQAYPNVATLNLAAPPSQVFTKVVDLVKASGWEMVSADQTGLIVEATDTTRLWQFKDDVVVRIRSREQGSIVDMRSVSRIGQSDLGANAKRIEAFMKRLAK